MNFHQVVRDKLYSDNKYSMTTESELVNYLLEYSNARHISVTLHKMVVNKQIIKIKFQGQTHYKLNGYGLRRYRDDHSQSSRTKLSDPSTTDRIGRTINTESDS